MQIRAGIFFLVQRDQHSKALGLLEQVVVLFFRTVAPENIFRLGEPRDFLDPIEHRLIRGLGIAETARRRDGWREVIHKVRPSAHSEIAQRGLSFSTLRPLLQANFLTRLCKPRPCGPFCFQKNFATNGIGARDGPQGRGYNDVPANAACAKGSRALN